MEQGTNLLDAHELLAGLHLLYDQGSGGCHEDHLALQATPSDQQCNPTWHGERTSQHLSSVTSPFMYAADMLRQALYIWEACLIVYPKKKECAICLNEDLALSAT